MRTPTWYFAAAWIIASSSVQTAYAEDVQSLIDLGRFDAAVSVSRDSDHYLARLIDNANALKLAQHPVWQVLVHYKKTYFFGMESQVDGTDFFLSEKGKHEPAKELHATLAAFFTERPVKPKLPSARCRFPARYEWLREQLHFDESRFPAKKCEELDKYFEVMDPHSLTVVFPSTHPNSPSSMFGHTLLRVNKKNQTEKTRMLAISINYAAQTDPNENSLAYTVLGLTGGYPGKFTLVPYYMKLREYAQIESRDLWEYDLDIPEEEMHFVLLHAFELAYSYFDYYFFSENCAYHLLSLLDVLYSDQPMSNEFVGWTIPVDTLKLLKKKGLIHTPKFYPSLARRIEGRAYQLTSPEQKWVIDSARNGIESNIAGLESFQLDHRVMSLDLLADYLRYRKIDDSATAVSSGLGKQERSALLVRSKIDKQSGPAPYTPPNGSPESGHGTERFATSYGRMGESRFWDLEWRAAYHDILDDSRGFVSSSGLEFMRLKVRYLPELSRWLPQNVDVLNIESFAPRNRFLKSLSWRTNAGWERVTIGDQLWRNRFYFSTGTGVAYSVHAGSDSIFYGMLDAHVFMGNAYEGNYSIEPRANIGFLSEPVRGWRMNFSGFAGHGVLGDKNENYMLRLRQSFALSNSYSIRLDLSRQLGAQLDENAYEFQFLFYY